MFFFIKKISRSGFFFKFTKRNGKQHTNIPVHNLPKQESSKVCAYKLTSTCFVNLSSLCIGYCNQQSFFIKGHQKNERYVTSNQFSN